jgi:hypothetical protein
MNQVSRVLVVGIGLGIAWMPELAPAAYSVSVGNLALAPGATGSLNVLIQSTSGSGDNLDSFGFDIRITTSGQTRLQFTPTQVDPFTNTSYVFFGNSSDQFFGASLGTVSQQTVPNDKYVGGDGTMSGSVHVGSTAALLMSLRVTAATAAPPVNGDSFTISLVNDSSTFFKLGSNSIAYTSQAGTVTITSGSTVPEPSSLVQGAVAGAVALAVWLGRRRGTQWRALRLLR